MTSKSERNNQLTQASEYDTKKMVFSEPQNGSVPNTPIVYKRIAISTLNKDGSIGDLILPTETLFSFGVSENIDPNTKKVNGHVLPLCLWSKEGPTKEEKAWTDTFEKIVEHCKTYLLDHKDDIGQYELTISDLKKLNPLYWKKDKGKIVEGTGPTLYAKLISSKKHNKILSMFFNQRGEEIDPLSLLGKYCYAKAAIKIESIFVGSKITLQVKLYEAECRLMDNGMRPLMNRPKDSGRMLTGEEKHLDMTGDIEDDNTNPPPNRTGSLNNNSDTEDEPKPTTTKVVKKVIKKVNKK
jgi:hypothetical protein